MYYTNPSVFKIVQILVYFPNMGTVGGRACLKAPSPDWNTVGAIVRRIEVLLVGWIEVLLVGWMEVVLVGWMDGPYNIFHHYLNINSGNMNVHFYNKMYTSKLNPIAHLSLHWSIGWVALSFLVCRSFVRPAMVTPNQISTFFNIYRHKINLLTIALPHICQFFALNL